MPSNEKAVLTTTLRNDPRGERTRCICVPVSDYELAQMRYAAHSPFTGYRGGTGVIEWARDQLLNPCSIPAVIKVKAETWDEWAARWLRPDWRTR